MRRKDFETLKAGMQLTGEAINEIGRRIVSDERRIAFLDSTFMAKVAPLNGSPGAPCRRQFWTKNVGTGPLAQIGTKRQIIMAPHHVPGHWCLAYADLQHGKLHYYDPLYRGPDKTRALTALGSYVDQVHHEQEREVAGTASLPTELHTHPQQPDGVSCGICVLIEIQRIADGGMNAHRELQFTSTELLRFRAKWACELLANPPERRGQAVRDTDTGTDEMMGDHADEKGAQRPEKPIPDEAVAGPQYHGSRKRRKEPQATKARRVTRSCGENEAHSKKKLRPGENPHGGKRRHDASKEDEDSADSPRKRPRAATQTGTTPPGNAPATEAGIPPQDMSVGENVPPEGGLGGLP
jgi:hypothetical protein